MFSITRGYGRAGFCPAWKSSCVSCRTSFLKHTAIGEIKSRCSSVFRYVQSMFSIRYGSGLVSSRAHDPMETSKMTIKIIGIMINGKLGFVHVFSVHFQTNPLLLVFYLSSADVLVSCTIDASTWGGHILQAECAGLAWFPWDWCRMVSTFSRGNMSKGTPIMELRKLLEFHRSSREFIISIILLRVACTFCSSRPVLPGVLPGSQGPLGTCS